MGKASEAPRADTPARRMMAVSAANHAAVGAYQVCNYDTDGIVIWIAKGKRFLAMATVDATPEELLGMAAAPAMARALVAMLRADSVEKNEAARASARVALAVAGVDLEKI